MRKTFHRSFGIRIFPPFAVPLFFFHLWIQILHKIAWIYTRGDTAREPFFFFSSSSPRDRLFAQNGVQFSLDSLLLLTVYRNASPLPLPSTPHLSYFARLNERNGNISTGKYILTWKFSIKMNTFFTFLFDCVSQRHVSVCICARPLRIGWYISSAPFLCTSILRWTDGRSRYLFERHSQFNAVYATKWIVTVRRSVTVVIRERSEKYIDIYSSSSGEYEICEWENDQSILVRLG